MSVVRMTRMDLGEVDWVGRADRIAAIAEAAVRHDADESFVSEGYQLLKAEGFFKTLVPAELGGDGAGYAGSAIRYAGLPRVAARLRSPSQCIRTS
jgi:alkylation response protein AidB-like acyl-CoA dehydrogenase